MLQGTVRCFHGYCQEGSSVYCTNVGSRMEAFIQQYDPDNWQLCIDSWKMGLQAVMALSRNARTEFPMACAIHVRELLVCENIHLPVQRSQYDDDPCRLCWTRGSDHTSCSFTSGRYKNYVLSSRLTTT
jgi:hypothetical protein